MPAMSPSRNDFRPRKLLRNPHLQSILASSGLRRWLFRRRRDLLDTAVSEHILDCGGGVRLQGFLTQQTSAATARGLVMLLHGWEGSAHSSYIVHTAVRLLREGYDVFRLNFRDHGNTHHLNEGLFHSCQLDEVVGAVKAITTQFPARTLALVGFSLGGNFALRVALRAPDAGIALSRVVAICPVINPHVVLEAIERAPWFYQRYFTRKWRGSLLRKQRLFPHKRYLTKQELRGGLREMTTHLVLRHTAFGSLDNYLNGYSIAQDRLECLKPPASILTAQDDPIIPVADFKSLKLSPNIELQIATHGGHCGFISNWSLISWAEDFIVTRLNHTHA